MKPENLDEESGTKRPKDGKEKKCSDKELGLKNLKNHKEPESSDKGSKKKKRPSKELKYL